MNNYKNHVNQILAYFSFELRHFIELNNIKNVKIEHDLKTQSIKIEANDYYYVIDSYYDEGQLEFVLVCDEDNTYVSDLQSMSKIFSHLKSILLQEQQNDNHQIQDLVQENKRLKSKIKELENHIQKFKDQLDKLIKEL